MIGTKVAGRYRLERYIGRGRNARVYEVLDQSGARPRALKLVSVPHEVMLARYRARFRQEVTLGERLRAAVEGRKGARLALASDEGLHADAPYLVLDLVEGSPGPLAFQASGGPEAGQLLSRPVSFEMPSRLGPRN